MRCLSFEDITAVLHSRQLKWYGHIQYATWCWRTRERRMEMDMDGWTYIHTGGINPLDNLDLVCSTLWFVSSFSFNSVFSKQRGIYNTIPDDPWNSWRVTSDQLYNCCRPTRIRHRKKLLYQIKDRTYEYYNMVIISSLTGIKYSDFNICIKTNLFESSAECLYY